VEARQLTRKCAQRIARKGGVVGLWAYRVDVGNATESYAERLMAMSNQIGEDHVGFGTDMNGDPVNDKDLMMTNYVDLRKVADYWQRKGLTTNAFERSRSETTRGRCRMPFSCGKSKRQLDAIFPPVFGEGVREFSGEPGACTVARPRGTVDHGFRYRSTILRLHSTGNAIFRPNR